MSQAATGVTAPPKSRGIVKQVRRKLNDAFNMVAHGSRMCSRACEKQKVLVAFASLDTWCMSNAEQQLPLLLLRARARARVIHVMSTVATCTAS